MFNALIRTHHITSRKKVASLKKAAHAEKLRLVLIRSGGSPGLMYAEGQSEESVSNWVVAVQNLRYKDYQLVRRVSPVAVDGRATPSPTESCGNGSPLVGLAGFREVESVAAFASEMDRLGMLQWWRTAMGFEGRNAGF